ncbi:MAG: hypothetical protein NTV43_14215 [Methylococcales bacterium]|nr:hypothetical protein [Methylococcales bacterium]
MTSIEYKILFEVRILHDYYLYGLEPGPGNSVKSFFAMSAENQSARLTELLKSGRYDIRKDLDLLIGADEERLFKNLKLKFVRTATGFFLGMQVERVVTNNEEIRFKPAILPSEDACVTIGLSIANPYFGSISNLRLDRETDKIYYFTNEGNHEDISLAALIPPLVSGQQYRMGDLALISGSVKQAIADNTGNSRFWSTVDGKGIVSQMDRSLDTLKDWYSEWRSTIRLRSKHPVGMIKIALMSGNGQFRPIDEKKLLTTRLSSNINSATHPVYELRWLSRKTYWRYSKRNGFSTKEREYIMNGTGSLLDIDGDKFFTKDPLPITRDRFSINWPGASIRLPNAQPGSMKAEGNKIFSDIEFNELNPVFREF